MKNIWKVKRKKKNGAEPFYPPPFEVGDEWTKLSNIFRQIYIKAIAEAHMKGERKRRKCEKPPGDGKELPARS